MPFGGDCEYKDFDACVKAHSDKKNPKGYCAELMRNTEEHCKGKAAEFEEARFAELFELGNGTRAERPPVGRQPWTFDPTRAVYRDADGNLLSERDVRAYLERFLVQQQARAQQVTRQLNSRELLLPEWETEMRWVIKNSVGASYLLGRGGRNFMDSRDWSRVGRISARQYGYLNQFAAQYAAGSMTENQAVARAALYPLSAKQAQSRGYVRARNAPDLPNYPGDGSTACLGNCLCSIELEEVEMADGTPAWNAYWRDQRGPNECNDCLVRSREWNPLVVPV